MLEVSPGEDPVLHLPEGENVGLIQEAQVSARPGPSYYPPVYSFWSPFTMGLLLGGSRPAYYDPPQTIVVPGAPGAPERWEAALSLGWRGTVSETARPPAQRVTGGAHRRQRARRGHRGGGAPSPAGTWGAASPRPWSGARSAPGARRHAPPAGSPGSSGGSGVTAPRSGASAGAGARPPGARPREPAGLPGGALSGHGEGAGDLEQGHAVAEREGRPLRPRTVPRVAPRRGL